MLLKQAFWKHPKRVLRVFGLPERGFAHFGCFLDAFRGVLQGPGQVLETSWGGGSTSITLEEESSESITITSSLAVCPPDVELSEVEIRDIAIKES